MQWVVSHDDIDSSDGAIQYLGSKPQAVDSAITSDQKEVRCSPDLLFACRDTHALVEVFGTPALMIARNQSLFVDSVVRREKRSAGIIRPIPTASGFYLVRISPPTQVMDKEYEQQAAMFSKQELGETIGALHVGALAAVGLRKKYGIDITNGRHLRTSDVVSSGRHHSMYFLESRLAFGVARDIAMSSVAALGVIPLH